MSLIKRRDLIASAAAASVVSSAAVAQAPANPSAGPPPNIVFFVADDMGFTDLSCYGRTDISTPHIDRIAADGVRFTQGYANSAVCSATRAALITGRYQYRLPVGLEEPISAGLAGLAGAAAQPPDAAFVAQGSGLRHDASGQIAPWRTAGVQPAQKRLRPFLGFSQRRDRLFHASQPGAEG